MEMLRATELKARRTDSFKLLESDLAMFQQPEAGKFVSVGAAISVTFGRQVPDVVSKPLSAAIATIRDNGFEAKPPSNSSRKSLVDTDVVVSQYPPHSTNGNPVLAVPGKDSIQINGVATNVPDLLGPAPPASSKTLTEAISILKRQKIEYEFEGVEATYRGAVVLRQNPRRGYLDKSKEKIQLEMVIPVPMIQQGDPIELTANELRRRNLVAEPDFINILPVDVVGAFEIVGKTYQDHSGNLYAPAKSVVKIAVARPVPPVGGMEWQEGVRILEQTGFNCQIFQGSSRGSHIFAVEPRIARPGGNISVMPGTLTPDVTRLTANEAIELISQRGLTHRIIGYHAQPTRQKHLDGKVLVDRQFTRPNRLVPKSTQTVVDYSVVELRYVDPRIEEEQKRWQKEQLQQEVDRAKKQQQQIVGVIDSIAKNLEQLRENRQKPIKTYGVLPGGDKNGPPDYLECDVSPDKKNGKGCIGGEFVFSKSTSQENAPRTSH